MLLGICSEIDPDNIKMWYKLKSGTQDDSPTCHQYGHMLTSSVISCRKDPEKHGIYLIYMMNKQNTKLCHLCV